MTNPRALGAMVEELGGTIVDDSSFSFPVNRVVETIPKIRELGVECRVVRQFREMNGRTGKEETVAVFKAYTKPDPAPRKGSYTGTI